MNMPSNEYMKKVKQLARDGKIHPGEQQNLFIYCSRIMVSLPERSGKTYMYLSA